MVLQAVPCDFRFHKAKEKAGRLQLSMKVVACSRVLFGLKIVNCSEEETFGNLISRLEEEHFFERRVEKVNIKDDKHRHEGYLIFLLLGTQIYIVIKLAQTYIK